MSANLVPPDSLILRQVAEPVIDFKEAANLIDEMVNTMLVSGGIGLAAPQIGVNQRLFVIRAQIHSLPRGATLVCANPSWIPLGDNIQIQGEEGCLSLPNVRVVVPRYKTILASYYDLAGQLHEREMTDLLARVFQHEYDHLQGKLITDYQ